MSAILAWMAANPGTAAAIVALAASMMPTDSLLRKLLLAIFTKPVPPGPTPVVPPTPLPPSPVVPPAPPLPDPVPNDRPIIDAIIRLLPTLIPMIVPLLAAEQEKLRAAEHPAKKGRS